MPPEQLRERTKRFAVGIVQLCRFLRRSDEGRMIGRQLLRSGTSIGANYRAVCRPRSDADFIAKLGVVIEEADETAFWLELVVAADIAPRDTVAPYHDEAEQLIRIFVASRETARRNVRMRQTSNGPHRR
jgi:four helix bundle protein